MFGFRAASRLSLVQLIVAVLTLLEASGAEAGEVRGRLVRDGRPAAGLSVVAAPFETAFDEARREARKEPAPAPLAEVLSGPDGAFRLVVEVPPGKPAREFRVEVRGEGIVPLRSATVFSSADAEALDEVSLMPGGAVSGVVLDPSGAPVAGAAVRLHPGRGGFAAAGAFGGSEFLPVDPQATTGADGSFRIPGASLEGNELLVLAERSAPAGTGSIPAAPLRRPVVVPQGIAAEVRILRTDGKGPARGALVHVEGAGARGPWVETDESGKATVVLPEPRTKPRLVAEAGDEGYAERPVPPRLPPAGQTLDVRLGVPAGLEGRVVDSSGRALPRVKVSVSGAGSGSLVRSGPDGRYRVRPVVPGTYRLVADDPRFVLAVKGGIVVAAAETRKVDVVLTPAAVLAGRVVDDQGNPVAGATGALSPATLRGLGSVVRGLRGARGGAPAFRTAADGTFVGTRLAPGDNLRLTVSHDDFEPATVGGVVLPPGGRKEGLQVVLSRGLVLAGAVVSPDGSPLSGASVTVARSRGLAGAFLAVGPRGGGRGGAPLLQALGGGPQREPLTTGADGQFLLSGLAAGDWSIRVDRPGYATAVAGPFKVVAGEEVPFAEVVLEPGASISGRAVRRSGEGVPDLAIVALGGAGGGRGPMGGMAGGIPGGVATTGPDGSFVLDGLTPGATYTLRAGTGHGEEKQGVRAGSDGVELTIGGSGTIKGTVVDASSGRPLTDFDVSWGADRGGFGGGVVLRRAAGAAGVAAGSGFDADAVVAEDGTFTLENVAAGTWTVRAKAKGYTEGRTSGVVVEEGGTRDKVEVRLSRGAVLKGHVTDASTGRAVPEATVTVVPADGAGGGPGGAAVRAMAASIGASLDDGNATDADGRFEVVDLAPGKYRVTVQQADFTDGVQTAEVTEKGGAVEVKLSRGGGIGGAVLSAANQPLPGVDVSLSAAGDGGMGGGLLGGGGQSTTTDGSGRFLFDHVSAGRYRVSAGYRGTNAQPVDVVLQGGETRQDLVLSIGAGATINGTITGLPPSLQSSVFVNANGPAGWSGSARATAAGTFTLEGAPVGAIALSASAGDMTSGTRRATAEVTVAEGQAVVPAEIPFPPGSAISGRVTRGGQGIGGAMVSASPRASGRGAGATARADDSGAFRLEGLEDGSYTLTAAPGPSGSFSPRSETVTVAGDTTHDLVVPSGFLAGSVVEAGSRQPLTGATVTLSAAAGAVGTAGGGGGARGAQSDSSGNFRVESVDPGSWTVNTRLGGYQADKRTIQVAGDGSDSLVVELARGDGIGIQARDGLYGIPLRSVTVRAADGSGSVAFAGSVSLDGDGVGEIPGLKPGSYSLLVSSSGYAARSAGSVAAPSSGVLLSLTPGGTLEVHVGSQTLGRVGTRARLVGSDGQPVPRSAFQPEGWFGVSAPVVRVANVASGPATLVVETGFSKSVTIPEGGTAIVELP